MRSRISVPSVRISVIVLCLMSAIAYASDGGSISGRVKDPSGSDIPDAVVQLLEVKTNHVYSTHAEAHGYYRLPVLPVGKYTLTVSAAGLLTIVVRTSFSTPTMRSPWMRRSVLRRWPRT